MRGKTNVFNYSFNKSFSRPLSTALTEDDFNVSDGLTYQFYSAPDGQWELAILTSGTINFKKDIDCEAFFVGGGKNGANGSINSSYTGVGTYIGIGGNGGNGGETLTFDMTISKNTAYSITIGDNDNNTEGFNHTAISGGGCAGGAGNSVGSSNTGAIVAKGTSSTTYAFNLQKSSYFYPDITFGAGGGGGNAAGQNSKVGNVNGNNDLDGHNVGGRGGLTGGGKGGNSFSDGNKDGEAGTNNYGAGGGGGGAVYNQYYTGTGNGGAGGRGIIILHASDFSGWGDRSKLTLFSSETGTFDTAFGTLTMKSFSGYKNEWTTNLGNQYINSSNQLVLNIPLAGAAKCSAFISSNTIDLTDYNTLKIKVSDYTTDGQAVTFNGQTTIKYTDFENIKLVLSTSNSISNNITLTYNAWNPGGSGNGAIQSHINYVNLTSPGVHSIDISTVTSSCYIWLTLATHDGTSVTIDKIWLE